MQPTSQDESDADRKVERSRIDKKQPGSAETRRAPGTPAPESIVGETEFVSPKGFRYRIIHTSEVDASDEAKASKPRRKPKKN
jgi:hypothetical protein